MTSKRSFTPVLVIGAGLAGCITALRLADLGVEVTLISAGDNPENANSWLAQGGVIYRGPNNDPKLLEKDIFAAGHGLNNPEAVHFLAEKGPDAVEELLVQRLGVPFDRSGSDSVMEGEWDLTREGGHSTERIIHCRDHTGRCIMACLLQAVYDSPRIRFLAGYTAVDLLTSLHNTKGMTYRYRLQNLCCGAYVFNEKESEVEVMLAAKTVIATGGIGQVYLHTTNSSTANGSGIAMASRALVRVEGMEYIQFHPTTLYHLEPRRVLITEALRGEGAILVNSKGERFMVGRAERVELAPRDVVSQAIMDQLYATGEPCVFLDARHLGGKLEERFPTVLTHCLERGIDIRKEPIPVVPAEHYLCGGILTDLHGRTTLEHLYAVGECACTGAHGANRLASTSLLEAVLWGKSTAEHIFAQLNSNYRKLEPLLDAILDWKSPGTDTNDDPALIAQDWATIKNTMWNYVGITRTRARLDRAFKEIRELSRHQHIFYKRTPLSKPIIDLFHGCQAAYLITQAALRSR